MSSSKRLQRMIDQLVRKIATERDCVQRDLMTLSLRRARIRLAELNRRKS